MSAESLATTERLLADNYSTQAEFKIDEWRQRRDAGQLFVVGACSDARLILPDMAYNIRTISATGPRSPWHAALNYSKVLGVLIIDHFDCGGLYAKGVLSGNSVEDEGALGYVRDHIWHTDPIYQSILTASWTASRTHKPVLAIVQDHKDGRLYIQGSFNNADQTENKTVPSYLLMSKYVGEDIYSNGMPELAENLVAPIFRPCLQEIIDKARGLANRYADFAQRKVYRIWNL